MLSQEDASTVQQIAAETHIRRSSVVRIIHAD